MVFQLLVNVHRDQSCLDSCLCFDLYVSVNVNNFMGLGLRNTIHHRPKPSSGSGEAETRRQGLSKPHCTLGTSHDWTSSQHTASHNHSEYCEHVYEQSGHTFGIVQFSLVFMYGPFYDCIRYITLTGVKLNINW